MQICDVYSCRGEITTIMSWSNRRLLLCAEHAAFYRTIAGGHIRFEPLPERIEEGT